MSPSHVNARSSRISPSARLLIAAAIAIALAIVPVTSWWILGIEILIVLVILFYAKVSIRKLAFRLLLATPLISAMAFTYWISQGDWRPAVDLLARSNLSLTVTLIFALSISANQLLTALDHLHIPRPFLFSLSFMIRFVSFMQSEALRIQQAASARLFRMTRWNRWLIGARAIGNLFLRSLDRSEQIHSAMLARGWSGSEPIWDDEE